MADKKESNLSDYDAQLFFDGAGKLLEAVEKDNENVKRTIANLIKSIENTHIRLRNFENDVAQKINESAEMTADKTATLLSRKFVEADRAAQNAAEKYQKAYKSLNVRTWIYYLGAPLVLLLIGALVLCALLPSIEEIEKRRAELSFIEQKLEATKYQLEKCQQTRSKANCFGVR